MATHTALRQAAAACGKSMSTLARELLQAELGTASATQAHRRYDWTFVGMAHGGPGDVATNHDRYLNDSDRW